VPRFHNVAGHLKQLLRDKLIDHKLYVSQYGDDMPEIKNWKWPKSA
jgi:xylulose-5-phosphate/fructose-6-phosphate phosphoketolase